jgi:hypothetical protein
MSLRMTKGKAMFYTHGRTKGVLDVYEHLLSALSIESTVYMTGVDFDHSYTACLQALQAVKAEM